jgi:thiosulfate dehydrogenase [quinone] large subunit
MVKARQVQRVSGRIHFVLIEEKERGMMRTFAASSQKQRSEAVGAEETARITLGERSLITLALVRLLVGYLWFQQLFWKMPPDFAGLRKYVLEESHYAFLPGYASFVQQVFLPHFLVLGASVWIAEFLVALSLMLGLFSRAGALLGTVLALQLYVGLAVAPGEWTWTYGMLVLLGVVLVAIPTGRRLGIDQWLAPRLHADAAASWWRRLLGWLV